MTTVPKSMIIVMLGMAIAVAVYEAHRASTLESELQVVRGQNASLAEKAQHWETQRDVTAHRPEGVEPGSKPSHADTLELLRLRGEVGLLRRELVSVKATPAPPTNHIAFTGLYQPREAWSDHGTDKPLNTILTMFWALRQGDQSKLEQLVSRARDSQTLEDLILRREDWGKISAIQVANTVVTRTSTAETAAAQIIVEKASLVDGGDKEVDIHRWILLKVNDQWLITNSY